MGCGGGGFVTAKENFVSSSSTLNETTFAGSLTIGLWMCGGMDGNGWVDEDGIGSSSTAGCNTRHG